MQFYSTLYIHVVVLAKIASQKDMCYFNTYIASYVVCQNSSYCMCCINTFTDMHHFNI